ncbi:hypothetical protein M231_04047 [Tremella mesenterica]|uniref:Uncharacterized protein n=1 Tax=Tremella mesenterica TaxID=5217 RepID=A0A4V1M410_TREME|nr:hypothetical protein M231_04047 [Tremella mesenterica]
MPHLPINPALVAHPHWVSSPTLLALPVEGVPLPPTREVLKALNSFALHLRADDDEHMFRAKQLLDMAIDEAYRPLHPPGPPALDDIRRSVDELNTTVAALGNTVAALGNTVAALVNTVAALANTVAANHAASQASLNRLAQSVNVITEHDLQRRAMSRNAFIENSMPRMDADWVAVPVVGGVPPGVVLPPGLPIPWQHHPKSALEINTMPGVVVRRWLAHYGVQPVRRVQANKVMLMTFLTGGM